MPACDACQLCQEIWQELDQRFPVLPEFEREALREHVLAAVGAWWVAKSLVSFGGDHRPLCAALTQILGELGLRVSITKVS